jgi:integrase
MPRLYGPKRRKYAPRPYTEEEMRLIWEILNERGTTMQRLAVAIGEESGLRIGEVCRLLPEDIDRRKQRIFVRLPTKTGSTRSVPYFEKTRKYLADWDSERDRGCGFLLYNQRNGPLDEQDLRRGLLRTFEDGSTERVFANFEFHRLRHTMATQLSDNGADLAVIMATGGWSTPDSVLNYTEVSANTVVNSYHSAMRRIRESAGRGFTSTESLEEFAQGRKP